MRVAGYIDRVSFILNKAQGKRVIDVGVVGHTYHADGPTTFAVTQLHRAIADAASHAIGIDPTPDEMPALMQRHPELDLRLADVECLGESLPVDPVDLVVMGDVIEHLSNPGRALDSVAPFLRGGAQVLITTPNAFGLPALVRYVLRRFRESPDHVTAHNRWTLANLLQRHGYQIDAIYTGLDHPSGSITVRLGLPVLRRLAGMGGTLIVLASPRAH